MIRSKKLNRTDIQLHKFCRSLDYFSVVGRRSSHLLFCFLSFNFSFKSTQHSKHCTMFKKKWWRRKRWRKRGSRRGAQLYIQIVAREETNKIYEKKKCKIRLSVECAMLYACHAWMFVSVAISLSIYTLCTAIRCVWFSFFFFFYFSQFNWSFVVVVIVVAGKIVDSFFSHFFFFNLWSM